MRSPACRDSLSDWHCHAGWPEPTILKTLFSRLDMSGSNTTGRHP